MIHLRFNSLAARLLLLSISVCLTGFIAIFSAEKIGPEDFIWIEAEAAKTVTLPLELAKFEGASAGGGIASRESELPGGQAQIEFYVSKAGTYTIWARCFWPNVCSNTFKYAIDNSAVRQLGENPIVNEWHWLSASSFLLSSGKHTLTLWSGEPESRVDKFLISGNASFIPAGMGESFDKYFDFQESEGHRFNEIERSDSGQWDVLRKGSSDFGLFAKPVIGGAFSSAMVNVAPLLEYTSQFIYRADSITYDLKFIFESLDSANYNAIELKNQWLYLYSVKNKQRSEIVKIPQQGLFVRDDGNHISINRSREKLIVKFNGRSIVWDDIANFPSAMVFGTSTGGIFLDNISVHADNKFNSVRENFHFTGASFSSVKPENTSNYFSNRKNGKLNWWSVAGNWNLIQDGFEVVEGNARNAGEEALLVFGVDDFMSDYEVEVSTRIKALGAVGICFFFQDENNHYLFKWESIAENIGNYVLTKKIDGVEHILFRKPCEPLLPEYHHWATIKLTAKAGDISVWAGDHLAGTTRDSTFREGKVGLWTNISSGASFDDISIASLATTTLADQNREEYELCWKYKDIAADFSYWKPEDKGIIKMRPLLHETGWYEYFNYLYKPLFETASLTYTKKIKDDFEMTIENSEISSDVNVNYHLTAYSESKKISYVVEVHDTLLIFTREKIPVKRLKIPAASMREFSLLSHRNNVWLIKIDNTDSLTISDELKIDSLNFGIGYSGIGVDNISLYKIVIDQKNH